ncbi:phospholipase/Carboxylesterase [Phlyctema vagabunda]|uniref:Acyl-protein thioesterase 1 n=1 Tax=Phlyctema vagabunda TaxID=108571 RepID=A0ABR4P4L7_9HELO
MPTITIPAVQRHTATIIMIHGLGDSGAGWTWLAEHWHATNHFEHVKFIFPSAPVIPITVSGGQPMPAWFDIVRPRGTTPFTDRRADQDEVRVFCFKDYFHDLIKSEVEAGIPAARIILGGFSQGGAMSIFSGITATTKLGGIFGLSCFLPLHLILGESLPKDIPNQDTPIFIGHGDRDGMVKLEWGQESVEILRKRGWNVEFRLYPGMQHTTTPKEIDDLKVFIRSRLEVSNSEVFP